MQVGSKSQMCVVMDIMTHTDIEGVYAEQGSLTNFLQLHNYPKKKKTAN